MIHLLVCTGNRAFASLASFALVSRQFREIALQRYYASLYVGSPRHWARLCSIKGIYTWVRYACLTYQSQQHSVSSLSVQESSRISRDEKRAEKSESSTVSIRGR